MFPKVSQLMSFAIIIILAACNADANPEEKVQINTMDSTSKVLKENQEELEAQTKKVEESLEKLDTEFDTTNNKN